MPACERCNRTTTDYFEFPYAEVLSVEKETYGISNGTATKTTTTYKPLGQAGAFICKLCCGLDLLKWTFLLFLSIVALLLVWDSVCYFVYGEHLFPILSWIDLGLPLKPESTTSMAIMFVVSAIAVCGSIFLGLATLVTIYTCIFSYSSYAQNVAFRTIKPQLAPKGKNLTILPKDAK